MTKNNSAKFAFYYMLSLVTLFIISIATGTILFEIINKTFLDSMDVIFNSSITGAFSAIIIATPVFYFINSKIYKGLGNGEIKIDSGIRKWFTYFILFVSSVVVIVSLINVLNTFLEGGLTLNFILQTLTVLVISLLIFSFYFLDIKRKDLSSKLTKVYFFISFILILTVFVSAIFFMDSPEVSRNKKIDQAVLQDFEQIKYEIASYYKEYGTLPQGLNEINGPLKFGALEMENEYVYNVINEEIYELCFEFKFSNIDNISNYYDKDWEHGVGYKCFQKTIAK